LEKDMKNLKNLTLVAALVLTAGCDGILTPAVSGGRAGSTQASENWVETFGVITESAQMPDGVFAYTLQYEVVGGHAINFDGDLIQGPLPQRIFNAPGLAVKGQKVRLRYAANDPINYRLLEQIRFQ
jgi:hypothetical protein